MASELINVKHTNVPVHEHNLPPTAHKPLTQNTSQYVLLLEIVGIFQHPWAMASELPSQVEETLGVCPR